ncbi:MAG: sigma-70 family RNA polymerase sigma factor [Acidimicrobiales bacterium]
MEPSELIEQHLDLVRRIVAQVAVRFPRHVDRAELARAGDLGLVEAARRFDGSRGVPFHRFAAARIRGAMLDTVRAGDWAPRSVRTSARELTQAEHALAGRRGHVPSNDELAAALAVSPADVAEVRANVARSVVLALDHLSSGAGGHSIGEVLADRTAAEPGDAIETRELMGYLRDAIHLLPERHRAVVVGYFIEGRSSRQLAGDLDVTESRVSQLRTEALAMLRDGIEAQYRVAADTSATGPGRIARRRATYATAIGRASTWRRRLAEPDDRTDTVADPAHTTMIRT